MRRAQLGLLLEVFIMIFILVIFNLFWGSYSRSTFLAGLLTMDESAVKHSCSNILSVIIGTEYVIPVTSDVGSSSLSDYLGVARVTQLPTADSLMNTVLTYFPELNGRIGVTVTPIGIDLPETSVGVPSNLDVSVLRRNGLVVTTCDFSMYSVDSGVTALVRMVIYQ